MITHIPTGKKFNNRLECKLFFGHTEYNRRVRDCEFTFHDGRILIPSIPEDLRRTYTK